MSFSPPPRRLSNGNTTAKREEHLIYALEAEEERIVNTLSRKLEQLREEKIELENALEAESESHVNRLTRELTMLRLAQQQHSHSNGSSNTSPGSQSWKGGFAMPSDATMLEAMRAENEALRGRLVDTERDYIRVARLNEIYREELIDHRRRLGLSVDNLIGLSSMDPYAQPTHQRSWASSNGSNSYSPSGSVVAASPIASRYTSAVPIPAAPSTSAMAIPRPSSAIRRPPHPSLSESTTPSESSASASDSPFPFSPSTSMHPSSELSTSITTNLTTPPSSASLNSNPPAPYPGGALHTLSYPSVPPPSLSSSLGSPTVTYPINRRGSGGYTYRGTGSRRESVERGARIAETGTLVPRSRAGSHSLAPTSEDPGYVGEIGLTMDGFSAVKT
ncbi:hypothetical protein HWV62_8809 [Athelia sp. TMB]|nr:hypothetical protein HWV62_8809 [Athelia sp. TMB]